MTISKRFKHYLSSLPLTEQFYFSEENTGVSFHWSSWDEFCQILAKHPDFEQRRNDLLAEIKEKTEPLKDEVIWINSAEKTTKSNMYDLYSLYLDSRVRDDLFHSEKQILYSESNSSGPFHSLTSLKWKDKERYRLFMLDKILKGTGLLRRFRLNLDLHVPIIFDKFPLRNSEAQVEQITEYGLILRLAGSKDFFCLSNSNRIKLQFKTDDLNHLLPGKKVQIANGESELEVSFTPDILESYGNKKNFSHSREDQIFIFIGFNDLRTSPTTEILVPFLLSTMEEAKAEMEELLKDYLPSFQTGIKRVS